MKTVRVCDYDPRWPGYFRELRDQIWPAVEDIALAIEHVGSTSVPGLAAKAVIDIDVVVAGMDVLPMIVPRLESLGYLHRGNQGVEGREAFRALANAAIPHHLYVCEKESLALRNHMALRDHLRGHPEAAAAYSELKWELARKYPFDMEQYVFGKTGFILQILAERGFPAGELSAIADANRLATNGVTNEGIDLPRG